MQPKEQRIKPNIVLARALYAGLAALVRLAKGRQNSRTKVFYKSIQDTWLGLRKGLRANEIWSSQSISRLQNAESNLRQFYLLMLWYSTEPYGNKEFKRVYSWREGTVGPLNALLNYAGAVLRELAVTRYPFPEPAYFQVREYRDGTVRVLPQSVAERTPTDRAVKAYWRAGYRGSAKQPRFLLSHPTLPELDFIDMIRAHVVELCRQCFIHNVPYADAHGYIRFLVHRLKPFLDWVYTRGRTGRKNFWPDADKELRRLTLEIRTVYGRNVGKHEGVTKKLDEFPLEQTVDWLRSIATEILNSSEDEDAKEKCVRIVKMVDEGIIVGRDVTKLMDRVTTLVQKEGNDWHRILFSGLHHPQSLRSIVFSGDTMVDRPGHTLTVAELPLVTPEGRGQADLIFFVRRKVSGRVVWTPVMLLELKTRTSIDFNLYSQESRSRQDRVPVSYVWKTALTGEEWEKTIDSIPPKTTLDQLDAYKHGLLQEYRELVPEDSAAPESLQKGVVFIDTHQNQSRVLHAFEEMMDYFTANLQLLESEASGWTCFTLEADKRDPETPPRVAVITSSLKRSPNLASRISSLESVSIENPFEYRVKDDRFLTLYLTVSSPTSFGSPAAWISMNWHLLNHLNHCILASQNRPRIFWLDLLGDYPTIELTKARFGLETLHTKREITTSQYTNLSRFLGTIEFVGLSSEVDNCILTGQKPELDALRSAMKQASGAETVIVVGGWAELKQQVPAHRQHPTAILEAALLDALPRNNTNIIWTDEGTQDTGMSSLYQCRCVRPLPYDSPRRSQIDEIIWNMPVPPRVAGWQAPRRADTRVVVHDTPTSALPFAETIQVPHLSNWARRFRGLSRGKKTVGRLEVLESAKVAKPMYGRLVSATTSDVSPSPVAEEDAAEMLSDAMSLAPSLLRPRTGKIAPEPVNPERPRWLVVSTQTSSKRASPMSNRLHLCPGLRPPRPNKSEKAYFELSEATRGWRYGSIPSPDEYTEDWLKTSRRPPLTGPTERSCVDTVEVRRNELRRLLSAARFLKKEVSSKSDVWNCCDDVVRTCRRALSDSHNEDALLEGLERVKKHILNNTEREVTWRLLYQARQGLVEALNSENRETLRSVMEGNGDVLSLYGNNLFLAVFAAAEKALGDTASQSIIQLWWAIAEWQLYQMGFKSQSEPEQRFASRYDFQAIYSNLLWRANTMKNLPQVKPVQLIERYGEAIWKDYEEGLSIWFVFPERETGRLVGGLAVNQESLNPRLGWYRCVIDPEQLSRTAAAALKGWNRTPILVASLENRDFLWMTEEEAEDTGWSCMGVLEYGIASDKRRFPIRWLKLSAPSPDVYNAIQGLKPGSAPSDLSESVNTLLKDARSWRGVARDVKCVLSIDVEKAVYRVEYQDATEPNAKPLAVQDTPDTDDLVRLLKYPNLAGEYPVADDGTLLRWDPLKDVEYGDIVVRGPNGEREWFSMTFLKPLIYRQKFLPGCYIAPRTCRELLDTRLADDATLVVKVDERLKNLGVRKHLRAILDGVGGTSTLHCLERDAMGIYDIALLAECEQLVDVGMGTRHQLNIDVKGLRGIQVPPGVAEYDRLSNAINDDIEESYEEAAQDSEVIKAKKEAEPSGPELKLFNVELGAKSRGSILTVTANFGESSDAEPSTGILVIELSKEAAKARTLDYESLAGEVVECLRSWNVSEDTVSETIRLVSEALRKEGVDISE